MIDYPPDCLPHYHTHWDKNAVRVRVSGRIRSPIGWVGRSEVLWVPRARVLNLKHQMNGMSEVTVTPA